MGLNFFGFNLSKPTGSANYLPDIFPMPIVQSEFVITDVEMIYAKILTDVAERMVGIPAEAQKILWDNCLQNEVGEGLITLLSKAMREKADLFLVYNSTLQTIRKALPAEVIQIRSDYMKSGKSTAGIFVSFKNYKKTDMVILYSTLEYCVIASLHKGLNVSKALQYKISDLRSSVSLADSAQAAAQASEIANALARGKDISLDAKDSIESHKPDLEATEKSIEFLDSKRSFYLGMPKSYINGDAPGGLGDSGEGDSRAIERGLKNYFYSIMKPVCEAIFDRPMVFKSQDYAQIAQALEAVKTFELVGDEYISRENKLLIVNTLLNVDSKLGEEPKPTPSQTIVPKLPAPNPAANNV